MLPKIIFFATYCLMAVLSRLFFPLKIVGRNNIPSQGNFILAGNHVSNLDPFLFGFIFFPRKIGYLAKESLFKNKVLGYWLACLGAFPVKRDVGDVGALREAVKRLRSGMPLVIFPEGTRAGEHSAAGKRDPKAGIGFLVAKSCSPVVPVRLVGTERVLPPGAKIFKRRPVVVIFGAAIIYPEKMPYPEIADDVMDKIHDLPTVDVGRS